ncbi:porin [Paucibacter sp. R3-3]|uniref:Porin n=1 Tax=Roseateles agri TaxID=3098619 RepID=A0ABU5DHF4_9BURK|nr:porin [Paucibacter sp. R3-3]MDY0745718.1 porin [Paucibacter sp. R3-3]
MKKTAPTLAALALLTGTAAFAQTSSVTIAGRVDMGPQYVDTGVNKTTRVDSGTYTASRLILRGNEDLGDGLSAQFYLEHRFNADTGAAQSAAKFWNAGSYVGLSSKDWGTITLGRQYTPIFWSFLFADDTGPMKLHGYSALQSVQRSNFARIRASASPIKSAGSLDTISGGVYSLGITSAFEDNQIVYKTPTFGGGFTAMISAEAPEGYAAGSGKLFSGNVEYRNGPLYASVAATTKQGAVPAGGGLKQRVSEQLASAMYEVVPGFKLWGNIHPWQMKSVASTELKGNDWMLGASYWFPQSELWINFASKKLKNCTDCDSSGWGIGYHYFLSKRTELYASIAQVSNDANSANTLNGFAPDNFGLKVRATSVGIATTF